MNIKKAVKKIVALSTAATMMGATILGATAQSDLGNYPEMFVTNGVYNGYIVIGDSAAPVDNIAQAVIASNMWIAGTSGGASSTVSVAGDAWKVGTVSDMLEIGEAIGPSTEGVIDFIDAGDLNALADGKLSSSQGTFEYEQFLHFDDSTTNKVVFDEEDNTGNDVTGLFFKVSNGKQIARYELDFLDAAQSDIDSTDKKLDDFEGEEITMLGQTFNIVKARWKTGNETELTLMGGSTRDTLNVGESREYTLGGEPALVELTFTNTANQARFKVNGETTGLLDEGETYKLADGSELGVSEVLHQDYAGGIQQAEFFIGANKIVLKDTNIQDTLYGGTSSLKVGEENIEDGRVRITGSMLTSPGTATDGELEIDKIEVNMTADDDFWVGKGEKLSDNPDLSEPQVLFTQNWDIEFKGINDKSRTTISLDSKNSEEEYALTFKNSRGDEIDMPLVYGGEKDKLKLGDKDDVLRLNNSQEIADEEYFILNNKADKDSITQVVQYKGADNSSESDAQIRFNILTGNQGNVDRSLKSDNTATLSLDGTTYTITSVTGGKDSNITVTGGINTVATVGVEGLSNYVITENGGKILITDYNVSSLDDNIGLNISEIDTDKMDDLLTAAEDIWVGNITATGTEVDLTKTGGATLFNPRNDDDHNVGYSAYGAYVDVFSGTSSSTNADTFDITIPEQQSEALVYVTTSGTSFASVTSTEGLVSVQVPSVAIKLASEVSSLSAQNVILIGGPCANSATNAIEQPGTDCAAGYNPGEARIKLYPNGNNWAMVVAGYSGDDTRRAGDVLANPATYTLSGTEVKVTGTSSSDISVTSVQ